MEKMGIIIGLSIMNPSGGPEFVNLAYNPDKLKNNPNSINEEKIVMSDTISKFANKSLGFCFLLAITYLYYEWQLYKSSRDYIVLRRRLLATFNSAMARLSSDWAVAISRSERPSAFFLRISSARFWASRAFLASISSDLTA